MVKRCLRGGRMSCSYFTQFFKAQSHQADPNDWRPRLPESQPPMVLWYTARNRVAAVQAIKGRAGALSVLKRLGLGGRLR